MRVWDEFTPLYLNIKQKTQPNFLLANALYHTSVGCHCVREFVFCSFFFLLSTLCRSIAAAQKYAYHSPLSSFVRNRLLFHFHFHSNCECCSILKNGQFCVCITNTESNPLNDGTFTIILCIANSSTFMISFAQLNPTIITVCLFICCAWNSFVQTHCVCVSMISENSKWIFDN